METSCRCNGGNHVGMLERALYARKEVLSRFQRDPNVSVLIIGAGINGAGVFRELALQGIDVLLVDRSDFCSGASAASSRMIHGGLRYLEFGEFDLVREALKERNLLLKNAPHCVHPLRTTIPIFSWLSGMGHSLGRFTGMWGERPPNRGALMVKAGLTLYDVFTRRSRAMPRHRFASRSKSLAKRPLLNPDLVCTATYYDAWISYPERLCLDAILDGEAFCAEAKAVNYVSVEHAAGCCVTLRDEVSGETFEVRPKTVVNATGARIDFTNEQLGLDTRMMGGTKGAHLVLANDELLQALDGDMIYYETPDGRVSVALPWLGKVLVGSTDIRVDDPDDARCEDSEVDYILSNVGEAFPGIRLDRGQVLSHFSGVRPLPRSDGAATVQISRRHRCAVTEPGEKIGFPVYSLIGGKWTTFRGVADQVADKLLTRLERPRQRRSEDLAIGSGNGLDEADPVPSQEGTRSEVLTERYGRRRGQVLRFIEDGSDAPLAHCAGYSRREIEFLVRNERVVHLDDLLLRRTALALLGELTPALLEELAAIAGDVLGWPTAKIAEEKTRACAILRERHGIDLVPADNQAAE